MIPREILRMPLPLRLAVAVIACAVVAPIASAATPPRIMYNRALEREEAVRPALDAPHPTAAAIAEAHRVIKAYERFEVDAASATAPPCADTAPTVPPAPEGDER